MNSLEQLNYYTQNSGIVFEDDRPYNIEFSGTTTAENIAADEDLLFALDPINDFNFDVMQSIDNETENHVKLEIDLSNNENMFELSNRYEVNFATAPRNVEYFKYEKLADGSVEDYESIGNTDNRANVWTAEYIQTNRDFKTVYNSVSVAAIDRTDPLTAVARIIYPPSGWTHTDVTNSGVVYETTGNEAVNSGSYYFSNSSASYLETSRPVIPADDDFTVEFYIESAFFNIGSSETRCIFSQGGPSGSRLVVRPDGKLAFYVNNSQFLVTSVALASLTRIHIALVRSSSEFKFYINGVEDNGFVNSLSVSTSSNTVFGVLDSSNPSGPDPFEVDYAYPIDADLEEIRISDIARYTTNFTPATTPHPAEINSLLLLHPTENPPYRNSYFKNDYPVVTVEKSFNLTFTGSDEVEGLDITRTYNYGQTVFLFREGYPSVIDAAVDQIYDAQLGTTTGGILSVYGQTSSVVSITGATRDEVNQFYKDVQYTSPGTEPIGDTITWNLKNRTDGFDEYTSAAGSFSMTANFP